MFYDGRELRRLWEVELFDGDPEDPDVKTHKETVIAWNAVAAIRMSPTRCVSQPKAVCFVTWPEKTGDPIYRIDSTAGPTDEEIKPSIGLVEVAEEEWK